MRAGAFSRRFEHVSCKLNFITTLQNMTTAAIPARIKQQTQTAQMPQSPSAWTLPANAPMHRVPVRPARYRQPNFDDLYDRDTLFYDCFRVPSQKRVALLGPPLLNLGETFSRLRITTLPDGAPCRYTLRRRDRHSQLWVEAPAGTECLRIEGKFGEAKMTILESGSQLFSGKNVLLTLNKNNRLEWIAVWVRFHRDVHGADAVLLYDTDSTAYNAMQLQDCLSAISGIDIACVVQWPFKYGPQGFAGKHWDSDYCQSGALEDARWRFLQQARAVANIDADELVAGGSRSVFDLAESSRTGYVSFWGNWVVGTSKGNSTDSDSEALDAPVSSIRHRDFRHCLKLTRTWKGFRRVVANRCPPKWAIVPLRCSFRSQWKAHKVTRMRQSPLPPSDLSYKHFREINTNWKYDRSHREVFDPERHAIDSELQQASAMVRWDA
jgi:hypothetical protein